MGERWASKLQFGIESAAAHGTPVVADTILFAAPFPINPDRQPHRPLDQSGIRSKFVSGRSTFFEYLVRNTISFDADHPLYFQALPALISCGLKGGVTPTEQTPSQGDYLWDFSPSETGGNSVDSMTLEAGDDTQAYEAEYVMFERLRFAGDINQEGGASPMTGDFDFFGRQWTATAFTGSLSLPSAESVNAKLARFYLDTAWASVGNTEVTGLLRGYEIEILTGTHHKFHGSANRYFDIHDQSIIEVMANFVFEGNSDADAIWDAFNAKTFQVLRLEITGSQIGTGENQKLTVDIGGTWDQVIPLAQEDRGNNLHSGIFMGEYDATGAKKLGLQVITDVSAI